jgi:hypothetical protein
MISKRLSMLKGTITINSKKRKGRLKFSKAGSSCTIVHFFWTPLLSNI